LFLHLTKPEVLKHPQINISLTEDGGIRRPTSITKFHTCPSLAAQHAPHQRIEQKMRGMGGSLFFHVQISLRHLNKMQPVHVHQRYSCRDLQRLWADPPWDNTFRPTSFRLMLLYKPVYRKWWEETVVGRSS
jgi:hypothetical protein